MPAHHPEQLVILQDGSAAYSSESCERKRARHVGARDACIASQARPPRRAPLSSFGSVVRALAALSIRTSAPPPTPRHYIQTHRRQPYQGRTASYNSLDGTADSKSMLAQEPLTGEAPLWVTNAPGETRVGVGVGLSDKDRPFLCFRRRCGESDDCSASPDGVRMR